MMLNGRFCLAVIEDGMTDLVIVIGIPQVIQIKT
jgi:hypothetical protein